MIFRTSNPAWGATSVLGGFDFHALPPLLLLMIFIISPFRLYLSQASVESLLILLKTHSAQAYFPVGRACFESDTSWLAGEVVTIVLYYTGTELITCPAYISMQDVHVSELKNSAYLSQLSTVDIKRLRPVIYRTDTVHQGVTCYLLQTN